MQEKKLQGWQRQAARNYLLKNPDASIAEAAQATGMGQRTVATARKQLVNEGVLPSGRNSEVAPEAPSSEVEQESPAAPAKTGKNNNLLDAEALKALDKMLDEVEADEDDAESQKKMLRQVKRMAFDLRLHPDTRMSAMQMWGKLRDMTAARALGPGKPLKEEDAIERLTLLFEAVGAEIAIKAMYKAFKLGEADGLETQRSEGASTVTETPSPIGHEDSNPKT